MISNSGGGGGGDVNSLTPDVGSAVTSIGGTIPTLGYQAGTVQTMRTYNDGTGNFRIADQTWQTQYVVDASTTNGLRGTFTTIQSAIDQAVSDGSTIGNYKTIFIRNGSYTEDLVISPGIILQAENIPSNIGGVLTPINCLVSGNHTFTGNCVCSIKGIGFSNGSGANPLFETGDATVVLVYLEDCLFNNATTEATFDINASSSFISIFNCNEFSGGQLAYNLGAGVKLKIVNYRAVGSPRITMNNLDCSIAYADGVGQVLLTNGASIFADNTNFAAAGGTVYCIDSDGTNIISIFTQCSFSAPTNGAGISAAVQDAQVIQCALYSPGSNEPVCPLIESGSAAYTFPSNLGSFSIVKVVEDLTAYTLLANDQTIMVDTTDTAVTINVYEPLDALTDGTRFEIKDFMFNATVNNITITSVSGTVPIDNSFSQVMDFDGEAVTLMKYGTSYYII